MCVYYNFDGVLLDISKLQNDLVKDFIIMNSDKITREELEDFIDEKVNNCDVPYYQQYCVTAYDYLYECDEEFSEVVDLLNEIDKGNYLEINEHSKDYEKFVKENYQYLSNVS